MTTADVTQTTTTSASLFTDSYYVSLLGACDGIVYSVHTIGNTSVIEVHLRYPTAVVAMNISGPATIVNTSCQACINGLVFTPTGPSAWIAISTADPVLSFTINSTYGKKFECPLSGRLANATFPVWNDTFVFPYVLSMAMPGYMLTFVLNTGDGCGGIPDHVPLCQDMNSTNCSGSVDSAILAFLNDADPRFVYATRVTLYENTFNTSKYAILTQGGPVNATYLLCKSKSVYELPLPKGVNITTNSTLMYMNVRSPEAGEFDLGNAAPLADGVYEVSFMAAVHTSLSTFDIALPCTISVIDVLKNISGTTYASYEMDSDGTGFQVYWTPPSRCGVYLRIADNGRGDDDARLGLVSDPALIPYSNVAEGGPANTGGTSNMYIVYALIPTIVCVAMAMIYVVWYGSAKYARAHGAYENL